MTKEQRLEIRFSMKLIEIICEFDSKLTPKKIARIEKELDKIRSIIIPQPDKTNDIR